MNIKTINLTGSEVAVKVGGGNSEIKNNGTEIIYASAASGIVAGADGVVSIPAGASVTVTDTRGTVYILGTGSVEVVGKDFVAPVFKPAATSGGGGTEDEVARNAISAHAGNMSIHITDSEREKIYEVDGKVDQMVYNSQISGIRLSIGELNSHAENADIHVTAEEKAGWSAKADLSDIPTSLPANGGNADTVDGKHSSDFYNRYGMIENQDICEFALSHISGEAFCADTVSGMPYDGWWFAQFCTPMDAWYKEITVTDINTAVSYKKTYNVATDIWTDWVKCSDGGNAASIGIYTEEKIAALEARIAALEGGTT